MRARRLAPLLAILLLVCPVRPAGAEPPALGARTAALLDGRTGELLLDDGATERVYPASTTKLLTALVAVQRGRLDQIIRVSSWAAEQAPDSTVCELRAGDEESLESLLYGLLLASGNDCADAIAEGLTGGHPERFVAWMNETAADLGARESHFANAHGLHRPDHYTTAYDMALIGRAALSDPVIQRIATAQAYAVPEKPGRVYRNTNDLLTTYPGALGAKTGWTEEAEFCLVAAARGNGRFLVAVVMGEPDRWTAFRDVRRLLDYGLADFPAVVTLPGPRTKPTE